MFITPKMVAATADLQWSLPGRSQVGRRYPSRWSRCRRSDPYRRVGTYRRQTHRKVAQMSPHKCLHRRYYGTEAASLQELRNKMPTPERRLAWWLFSHRWLR